MTPLTSPLMTDRPPIEGADALPLDDLVAEVVETADAGPLRVLLLEDNDDHAALVEALLEGVTPEVTLVRARTAVEAVEHLRASPHGPAFDAVLADQQLPDSSYWETIERLADAARQTGASTAFTAQQAADAIEVLAKNGLDTEAILQGALRATVNLAGGLGSELAPSADLVTDMTLVKHPFREGVKAQKGVEF